MSRSLADLPERLLEQGATGFERRILEAAAQKQPSPEMCARMAGAIGVAAPTVVAAAVAKQLALDAAAAKATAAAGSTATLPWLSVGVLGLVVAGAVVSTQVWKASPLEPPPASAPVTTPVAAPPPAGVPEPSPALVPEPPSGTSAPIHRGRSASAVGDLREQIALIDAARAALSAGTGRRALEIVRRYQDRYPGGSFRPEAAALKIEALIRLGRDAEARALAERFVAEHNESMLADRVAEVAGLPRR